MLSRRYLDYVHTLKALAGLTWCLRMHSLSYFHHRPDIFNFFFVQVTNMCTLLWPALEMPQDCQRAAAAAALSGLVQHWYFLLIWWFLLDSAPLFVKVSTSHLHVSTRMPISHRCTTFFFLAQSMIWSNEDNIEYWIGIYDFIECPQWKHGRPFGLSCRRSECTH